MALSCPSCNSDRIWRDGIRQTRDGDVQRYLCRECGYRFSQTSRSDESAFNGSGLSEGHQRIHTTALKRLDALLSNRQICVTKPVGAKNLAKQIPRTRKAAGATKPDPATIKGLIVQFAFHLQKEGHENSSYPLILKRLVNNGANLLNPESVKETIAKRKCKDATKILEVYAYDAFAKMLNIEWSKPH